jgi:hypothetical protein
MELPRLLAAEPTVLRPAREVERAKPFDPHWRQQEHAGDAAADRASPKGAAERADAGPATADEHSTAQCHEAASAITTHDIVAGFSDATGDLAAAAQGSESASNSAALLDSPLADAPVQVIVQGHGAEVIELPWRLCASGRFVTAQGSALDAAPPAGLGSTRLDAAARALSGAAAHALGSSIAGVSDRPGAAVPVSASLAASVSSPAARGRAVPDAAATAALGAAAPDRWREQLWRAIERNGETTLYIRDYRLDESEHAELTRRLAETAQERGLTLSRVVINGRVMAQTSA